MVSGKDETFRECGLSDAEGFRVTRNGFVRDSEEEKILWDLVKEM